MAGGEESAWGSDRERVTYEEGRRVMEAQKSDIDDIDDKALRTVRVTALISRTETIKHGRTREQSIYITRGPIRVQ